MEISSKTCKSFLRLRWTVACRTFSLTCFRSTKLPSHNQHLMAAWFVFSFPCGNEKVLCNLKQEKAFLLMLTLPVQTIFWLMIKVRLIFFPRHEKIKETKNAFGSCSGYFRTYFLWNVQPFKLCTYLNWNTNIDKLVFKTQCGYVRLAFWLPSALRVFLNVFAACLLQ